MPTKAGWLLIILSFSAVVGAQTNGTITGVVVNEMGSPVPKAQVLASKMEVRVGSLVLQYHETDDEGRFTIKTLPWGTYRVSAKKEDDGYPGPDFGLYPANSEFVPVVNLQPGSPTASVTVRLPPKAGAIESISVVDAVTGKEMNSAAITLRRVAEPAIFVETSTTMYPVLVPSNTDVSIEISAPGYKSWPEKGETKKAEIRLKPEQGVKLDVRLAPNGSIASSVAVFSPAPYAPARNIARPEPKPSNPILSREVNHFSVTAEDISAPIERLARKYLVPIGFEALLRGVGTKSAASVQVDVEAGTVRDVLNAIIAADPRYTWEEADSRTIDILPKEHTDSLLDVVVTKYSYQLTDADDGINYLIKAPEVQRWIAREGVELRELSAARPQPSAASTNGGHISLSNASVRRILNFLLIFSESHYWIYYRYGDHNQFFVLSTGG